MTQTPGWFMVTTADTRSAVPTQRTGTSVGVGTGLPPPPHDHPLMQFDNVLASPHTAGVTTEARENMGRIAAEQMLDALDGKRPPRVVNPEVWPIYVGRFERTFGFAPA